MRVARAGGLSASRGSGRIRRVNSQRMKLLFLQLIHCPQDPPPTHAAASQVPPAVTEWVGGLGEGRNWAWRFMTALISGEADNVLSSVGECVRRSGKTGERLWLVRRGVGAESRLAFRARSRAVGRDWAWMGAGGAGGPVDQSLQVRVHTIRFVPPSHDIIPCAPRSPRTS